jgi:hypothetical protein
MSMPRYEPKPGWQDRLHDAIIENFGDNAKPETSFNIFAMRHVTTYNKHFRKEKKRLIQAFIRGFMAAEERIPEKRNA